MKNSFIGQGWLVLALGLGFGAALAGVEVGLKDAIKANRVNETYDEVPALVVVPHPKTGKPTAADKNKTEVWVTDDPDEKVAYKAFAEDGAHLGWVVPASGSGFADKVIVLIGLDAEAKTITGLYVLDQKETPNLGSRITDEDWRAQFKNKTSTKLGTDRQGDEKIDALSGATISSDSVCGIVNKAVAEFRTKMPTLKKSEKD